MKKISLIILGLAVVVLIVVFVIASAPGKTTQVEIVGNTLDLIIVESALAHAKGLSGVELHSFEADGMLFVFKEKQVREFWMKGMRFDLDVLWIRDGKIVKIDRNVPAPEKGEEPIRMYSRPLEVDMVIELPAGGVDEYGFVEGQVLTFDL